MCSGDLHTLRIVVRARKHTAAHCSPHSEGLSSALTQARFALQSDQCPLMTGEIMSESQDSPSPPTPIQTTQLPPAPSMAHQNRPALAV